MVEILIAVAWFVGLAGFANLLQKFFRITYQKHWYLFIPLYLLGVAGIYLTTNLPTNDSFTNQTGIAIGLLFLVGFILFQAWWGTKFSLSEMYRPDTLQSSYIQLLAPNAQSASAKASEIFVQDIILLVIISELLVQGYSYLHAGIVFSLIVFVLHIPAVIIIGKIYGNITKWFATALALFIPVVIGEFILGFYIVFCLHLTFYAALLVWSFWMQNKKPQ